MPVISEHLGPFMLLFCRLGGLFLIAPVVSSVAIPAQARVLLTLALALCVYPALPPGTSIVATAAATDVLALALVGAGEVFVGFLIGLIGLLPVTAVQLSGMLMGQQLGFGLGQIVNPALDTESDILGELLLYVAIGAFLAIGGLETLFIALCGTFKSIPLGGFAASQTPAELITGLAGSGFDLALRVSTPVMGILLLETVASACIARTLPQLNVTNLGFGIKIVLGIVALCAGLAAIDSAVADHIRAGLALLLEFTLRGKPAPGGGA